MINWIVIGAVICLIASILTLSLIRKQSREEWDTHVDRKVLNNPVKSNPFVWSYVLFPLIVIVLGFALYMVYRTFTGG